MPGAEVHNSGSKVGKGGKKKNSRKQPHQTGGRGRILQVLPSMGGKLQPEWTEKTGVQNTVSWVRGGGAAGHECGYNKTKRTGTKIKRLGGGGGHQKKKKGKIDKPG